MKNSSDSDAETAANSIAVTVIQLDWNAEGSWIQVQ
jgi:hypothetical protein